jgi:hypothetical protein
MVMPSQRSGLEIEAGATEAQCVRRVRNRESPETARYFQEMTALWQAVAYAHRDLEPERFEALATGWPAFFSARGNP